MIRSTFLPFGTPSFSEEEIEAVARVLRSGWIGMGQETIDFERELAAFLGAHNLVLVNSCTSALFLSLLVAGVKAGDEVVLPSLTWCSTANAALYLGARVRFCDVDLDTLCAAPESVLASLTDRTRAVIVVHYGGYAADVRTLRRELPPRVTLIEDAAHAFGASYADGLKVGSLGSAACFSFYANKNITTGEGGAIAVADDDLAQRLRSLRQHGLPADAWKRYTHPRSLLSGQIAELGYKMNLTDLQAAIGRVQLRRHSAFAASRREIARYYLERLRAEAPSVSCQPGILEDGHARHLFAVRLPGEGLNLSRDDFVLALRERNIGVSIHYSPLHLMPFYRGQADGEHDRLPNTERLNQEILTLPISAGLTSQDAAYVCDHFLDVLRRAGHRLPAAGRKAAGSEESAHAPRCRQGGSREDRARADGPPALGEDGREDLPALGARRPASGEMDQAAEGSVGEPLYGFYGHLSSLFPSQIIIDVTDACNLACVHCPRPQLGLSGRSATVFLDPDLCKKAVDEVRQADQGVCGYVRYTGEGEPLMHRQILGILAHGVRYSGTMVALTTNGTLMDGDLVEGLLDTGLHVIDVSVDAFRPETYARIRVNGSLQTTRANVLNLIRRRRERGEHTRVVVSYVEQPVNRRETADFQAFWEDAGADYVVVRRLHSAAGAIQQTAAQMRQANGTLARRACTYPWERIVLNPQGFLCYCPAGWSVSAKIEDYRHTTIRATWRSEFYGGLRRAHLRGDYSRHAFCGQCPDWSATRWPDEGRSYANMIADFKTGA